MNRAPWTVPVLLVFLFLFVVATLGFLLLWAITGVWFLLFVSCLGLSGVVAVIRDLWRFR